jgi:formylglycine-generating enzyme required for sulfatase activity
MKKIIIILILGIGYQVGATNRPEVIPSKLTEVKASSWYKEKFRSWKTYLAENPEDKSGWVEYFKAGHYSGMSAEELTLLSEDIASRFEASSEAYLVKAKLQGWTADGVKSLDRALGGIDKRQLLPERIMMAEIKGTDRQELTRSLYNSNLVYSSLLNYSYNVLMSVGMDGLLFTEGENTTIPLWILQDVMKVRQDVQVLNLDLLTNAAYQRRKFEDIGLKIDQEGLTSLPVLNPEANFYYALTMPRKHLEQIENRLYVVGLTSQLSNENIDNYALIKENIEERFLLDYLSVDFNGEPKTATGRTLEPNYIVPFMLLKQYYEKTNDPASAKTWKDNILTIADRSQIKARVEMLLKSNANVPNNFKKTTLDIKELDKHMTKVKDNIYASITELTNKDYEFFLDYLQSNGYTDQYETAAFDLSKYKGMPLAMMRAYHFSYNKSDRGKPMFSNFPAMEMTYEAAKLYCEWLTAQYNVQEDRKFKKVKFRLPSRKEWTMAALGYVDFQTWEFEDNIVKARPDGDGKPRLFEAYRIGDYDSVSYPWYHSDWFKHRNAIVNDKGCPLANINMGDKENCNGKLKGDGFIMTSPVATYFSGDMGLYDVIGNVAEMIDEKGKAMGGSWDHVKGESTITSVHHYQEADDRVGFRVFMDVIEE